MPVRIGVFNPAFLGDAILTLPLLQSLALAYPAAKIDFFVRGGFAALFQGHPALHEVIAYDKRGLHKGPAAFFSLAQAVARRQYAIWISPHLSLRSGLLAKASGAPLRVGYTEAACSVLCYTQRVARSFGQLHEVDRLLNLLLPLGIPAASIWPELFIQPEQQQEAEHFFCGATEPILGLHPGSVWPTKRWPVEHFARLACLALKNGMRIVIFSGKEEVYLALELEKKIETLMGEALSGRYIQNLAGQLTLPQLAAYLRRLTVFVSNDSGPMHLAWVQRVPTIAIFGPTHPTLGFAPRGEHSIILEKDLPCRPCGLHGAKRCPQGHHACLRDLSPETVWRAVRHLSAGIEALGCSRLGT